MSKTSKQDGARARTPSDIEQKYNFGKTFAEVYGLITDAQKTADEAKAEVNSLDQAEIFNRLTNNGEDQGVYRQDNKIYINADYIQSGTISSRYIDAYNLEIENGAFVGGTINVNDNFVVNENGDLTLDGDITFPEGYVGHASGMYQGKQTKGVAIADKATLQNGELAYESDGRYVIVTDSGVRMQAGRNNVTLTNNGIYLAIKTTDDAVLHRLCVEPDGLWWEVGETRYKIAGDTGLITGGDTNG